MWIIFQQSCLQKKSQASWSVPAHSCRGWGGGSEPWAEAWDAQQTDGHHPSSIKEGPGPGATEEGGSSLGDEESVCLGLGPPLFTPNYPICPSFICWIPTYDLVLMWSPLLRTVSNTPGLEVI